MITTDITTLAVTGSELKVEFKEKASYFWVLNKTNESIYVSLSPDIEPGADGVMEVDPKEAFGLGCGNGSMRNAFYLLGSGDGEVRIKETNSDECPFKTVGGGGDGSGGTSPGTTSNEDWKAELDRIYGSR